MKTEDFKVTKERSVFPLGWIYVLAHPDWAERMPAFAATPEPTAEAIRGAIETVINDHTRTAITEGFVYDFGEEYGECRVWLSAENQANYAAWLKAVELGLESVTLKVENAEGAVCYPKLKAPEYIAFYMAVVGHIKGLIEKGWQDKDAIDYNTLAATAAEL